mgnify:CR=1 FL=1
MTEPLLRAQVMLTPEDYQQLKSLAEAQGKSLSEMIREAVNRYLAEQEQLKQEQFLQALEEIRRIRQQNAARHGVYQGDLVNEAREERQRQIEDVWKQWS